eukprot:PhM_4_TR4189/c0_g1_i1/m.29917
MSSSSQCVPPPLVAGMDNNRNNTNNGGDRSTPTSALTTTPTVRRKSLTNTKGVMPVSIELIVPPTISMKAANPSKTSINQDFKLKSLDMQVDVYIAVCFVKLRAELFHSEPIAQNGHLRMWVPDGATLTAFDAIVREYDYHLTYVPKMDFTEAQRAARKKREKDDRRVSLSSSTNSDKFVVREAQRHADQRKTAMLPTEFSTYIYNIEPSETVVVEASYFVSLDCVEDVYSMSLPVPTHPHDVSSTKVHGSVYVGMPTEVVSTTHAISLDEKVDDGDGGVVRWSLDTRHVSNIPFLTITYTIPCEDSMSARLLIDGKAKPNACLCVAPSRTLAQKPKARDIRFLLDTSTSMGGRPLRLAKKALLHAIRNFGCEDTFNVIKFSNVFVPLSKKSVAMSNPSDVNEITRIVEGLEAHGGTDILSPLRVSLAELNGSTAQFPVVFLVTDGAVENEREIVQMVREYPRVRVFCLGIGSYCNVYFLRMLSTQGRGSTVVCPDVGTIAEKVGVLLERASRPVLTDVVLHMPEALTSNDAELYPSPCPDMFAGTPFLVAGSLGAQVTRGMLPELYLTGKDVDLADVNVPIRVVRVPKHIPLDLVYAKKRIEMLIARAWLEPDAADAVTYRTAAADMSSFYGIPCPYTVPVCFETSAGLVQQYREKMQKDRANEAKMMRTSAVIGAAAAGSLIGILMVDAHFGSVAATVSNLAQGAQVLDYMSGALESGGAAGGTIAATADGWCCCDCDCDAFC